MTAWEILIENSTVSPSSTAWVHLNNQGGGGTGVFHFGGELDMDISNTLSMDTSPQDLTMDIGETLTMNIETINLSANSDNSTSMEVC